jgi:transcriptional regulator GlxA family with amidase domain
MYHNPKSNAELYHNGTARSAQVDRKHHFIFLLLPGANMLDFTAAIEPLRVCNALKSESIYSWAMVSENGAPVLCSNGLSFSADGGLPSTQATDHIVVCSGDTGYMEATGQTLQWLRKCRVAFKGEMTSSTKSMGGVDRTWGSSSVIWPVLS